MSERNYYVLCDDNCRFPGMTAEQILSAITQAVEGGEIHDVDTGFVTRIKDQNDGVGVKMWIGTSAQFIALAEKEDNTLYILTDDDATDVYAGVAANVEAIMDGTYTVGAAAHATSADRATADGNGDTITNEYVHRSAVRTYNTVDYKNITMTAAATGYEGEVTISAPVGNVMTGFSIISFTGDSSKLEIWETDDHKGIKVKYKAAVDTTVMLISMVNCIQV